MMTGLCVRLACLLVSFLTFSLTEGVKQPKFGDTVGREDNVFVQYFIPGSSESDHLKPIWESLVGLIDPEKTQTILMKVDCEQEREFCDAERVQKYPSFKLYLAHNETGILYLGPHELDILMEFLRKLLTIEIKGLRELREDNYQSFLSKGHHFVKFYAPWCLFSQKAAPHWDRIAAAFEHESRVNISAIDCEDYEYACGEYDIEGLPTLLWFDDGVLVEKYSGTRSYQQLEHFINNKLEAMEEIQGQGASHFLPSEGRGNKPIEVPGEHKLGDIKELVKEGITFVQFLGHWCSDCAELGSMWEEWANEKTRMGVKVVKVDCTELSHVCVEQRVSELPSLLIFKDGQRMSPGPKNIEEDLRKMKQSYRQRQEL